MARSDNLKLHVVDDYSVDGVTSTRENNNRCSYEDWFQWELRIGQGDMAGILTKAAIHPRIENRLTLDVNTNELTDIPQDSLLFKNLSIVLGILNECRVLSVPAEEFSDTANRLMERWDEILGYLDEVNEDLYIYLGAHNIHWADRLMTDKAGNPLPGYINFRELPENNRRLRYAQNLAVLNALILTGSSDNNRPNILNLVHKAFGNYSNMEKAQYYGVEVTHHSHLRGVNDEHVLKVMEDLFSEYHAYRPDGNLLDDLINYDLPILYNPRLEYLIHLRPARTKEEVKAQEIIRKYIQMPVDCPLDFEDTLQELFKLEPSRKSKQTGLQPFSKLLRELYENQLINDEEYYELDFNYRMAEGAKMLSYILKVNAPYFDPETGVISDVPLPHLVNLSTRIDFSGISLPADKLEKLRRSLDNGLRQVFSPNNSFYIHEVQYFTEAFYYWLKYKRPDVFDSVITSFENYVYAHEPMIAPDRRRKKKLENFRKDTIFAMNQKSIDELEAVLSDFTNETGIPLPEFDMSNIELKTGHDREGQLEGVIKKEFSRKVLEVVLLTGATRRFGESFEDLGHSFAFMLSTYMPKNTYFNSSHTIVKAAGLDGLSPTSFSTINIRDDEFYFNKIMEGARDLRKQIIEYLTEVSEQRRRAFELAMEQNGPEYDQNWELTVADDTDVPNPLDVNLDEISAELLQQLFLAPVNY